MMAVLRQSLAAIVTIALILPASGETKPSVQASIADTYDYDAFGNLLHSTGTTFNEFLFAGEQFDSDLNLYYNRARYLNVSTGRFWTIDDFEGNSGDPKSLHKYLYAGANPVSALDPSGHDADLVSALGAAALTGFLSATVTSLYLGKGLWQSLGYGLAGAAVALTLTANVITGGALLATALGVSTSTGIAAYGGTISGVIAIRSLSQFLAASGGPQKNAAAVGLVVALAGFFLPLSAGTPNIATEQELIEAIATRAYAGKNRAVGYAIFEADGRTGFATSVSGDTDWPGTVGATGSSDPQFSPLPTREYDAEYKLLENIASQLSRQSQGRAVIVINKDYVCLSCQSVLQQFKEAYPGIQIEIRTASGRLAANPFN